MSLTLDPRPIRPGYSSSQYYTVHDATGAVVGSIEETSAPVYGRFSVDVNSPELAALLKAAGQRTYWRNMTQLEAALAGVQ